MHIKNRTKQALIVCGLGYGDECKGSITDYLARHHEAHTVIRYNGGAQAAHNVVLSDGRHHTFSQFGSASFVPGVRTHLSHFVLVNPIGMMIEASMLDKNGVTDIFARTTVDERALLITPFHCSVNRLRELARGSGRYGSCGQGIGETVRDAKILKDLALKAADLHDLRLFRKKMKHVRDLKISQAEEMSGIPKCKLSKRELAILYSHKTTERFMDWCALFTRANMIVSQKYVNLVLKRQGTVIFEGAQGVLLDEKHGFHPYVTWTNTTTANAESILDDAHYKGSVTGYGLFRAYTTRHGAGPFVAEDTDVTRLLPDAHNKMHEWQRGFRAGWFDLLAARYALSIAGKIDHLAISCVDRLAQLSRVKTCVGYRYKRKEYYGNIFSDLSAERKDMARILADCTPVYSEESSFAGVRNYLKYLEAQLKIPISLVSKGPTEKDKKFIILK